jgi:hypothetical protein
MSLGFRFGNFCEHLDSCQKLVVIKLRYRLKKSKIFFWQIQTSLDVSPTILQNLVQINLLTFVIDEVEVCTGSVNFFCR